MRRKRKVLFICTHNSARSQMAEALLRAVYGEFYQACSAGTMPSKVNPFAVRVMKEIGIDISKQQAKSLSQFRQMKFDWVVTVCDKARESCPFYPGDLIIHKSFQDPSQLEGSEEEILEAFRKCRDKIKDWIVKTFKPRP